ncbi:MAG: porin [Armatimonadota bacterium]
MRRTITTLVVGLVLLSLVAAAQAQQSEIQVLRDSVKQLSDQLKAVTDKLQALETKQATPVAAPAAKSSWADKVQINGYLQPQYIWRNNATDDFMLRRMYLNIAANVTPRTQAVVQFERIGGAKMFATLPVTVTSGDPAITLSSCYLNWKIDNHFSVMAGQVPTSFGWDEAESSSKRLPLERFAATEGPAPRDLRPPTDGLFSGGPWDRGVYLTRKASGQEPTVTLGLVNGNYVANDNNDNKTYSIDLKWKRGSYLYGASWVDGKLGAQGATQDRQAFDLIFHKDPTPWGFQAEYLRGKWGIPTATTTTSNREGWYGQVAYNKGGMATPFVRYEQFDKANLTLAADTFMALHLGCAWQLDKYNELTAQYTDAHLGITNMGYSGVQWQIGF